MRKKIKQPKSSDIAPRPFQPFEQGDLVNEQLRDWDSTRGPISHVTYDFGETHVIPPAVHPTVVTENLRKHLSSMMTTLEGKGVRSALPTNNGKEILDPSKLPNQKGDPEFEQIRSQASWWKRKITEKTSGAATLTTCIEVLYHMLNKSLQKEGLKTFTGKKDNRLEMGDFGNLKQLEKQGIFTFASPNMNQRPKKGDIYITGKRGPRVTKAENQLNYVTRHRLNPAREKSEQALVDLMRAQSEYDDVEVALKGLLQEASNAERDKAERNLKRAKRKLDQKAQQLEKAMEKVDEELKLQDKFQEELNTKRQAFDISKSYRFQHTGFIAEDIETEQADVSALDHTEKWKTFDGGQTFGGQIGGSGPTVVKQGAITNTRIYDPKTNEIWGMNRYSIDAKKSWLLGWYNLDKLAESRR